MELKELVRESRSFRSFQSGVPIGRPILEELVALAQCCPAAMNLQVMKYRLVTDAKECTALLGELRFAAALSQKLPPEGREPTGYIVICQDLSLAEKKPLFYVDAGIVAQTMMLGARERGFGGCMIGSASEERIRTVLALSEQYAPLLILALGVPDEHVVLTTAENGAVKYYRDDNGTHYVPKRPLSEIIL